MVVLVVMITTGRSVLSAGMAAGQMASKICDMNAAMRMREHKYKCQCY